MVEIIHPRQRKNLFLLFLFAVAMGFLEAAVVIYLRKLYYPVGFSFPLKIISPGVFTVEIIREFSTIIMIFSIAWLSGKNFCERLAFFLFVFAVWDIFYYVFLKVSINWPASFMTWDLLFLIPIPWIAPVAAPVACSLEMVVMSFAILRIQDKNPRVCLNLREWIFVLSGSLLILFAFLLDFALFAVRRNLSAQVNFIPQHFWWAFFVLGIILILLGIFLFVKRNLKNFPRLSKS